MKVKKAALLLATLGLFTVGAHAARRRHAEKNQGHGRHRAGSSRVVDSVFVL